MKRFIRTLVGSLFLTMIFFSPALAARFVDNGDQTITDTQTGLIWTKNANMGAATYDFKQGLDYIAAMNAARTYGRQDWRMPNLDELWSLVDTTRRFPALPAGHPFTNVGDYYWSSTEITGSISVMNWEVDFQGGNISSNHTWNSDFIWPVRGPAGSGVLANGSTGTSYSQALSATWGSPPYAWSLASGALPAGLSLNAATGVISGTTTRSGVYSFTVRATDSLGVAQYTSLAIAVSDLACSNLPVLVGTSFYPDFPRAYAQAADGAAIELQGLDFSSDLLVNRDVRVSLQGGYDCGYSSSAGNTGVLGALRVTGGTVKVAQLHFR